MNRFIGKELATVYFGLRADEPERVGAFNTKHLNPAYPLREAGIGLATVYRIVGARGLMPPTFFWQRLWDEVARQVGEPKHLTEWMSSRLFAWRSRPNCSFCFFQRRYEWVGLLWNHPELFDEAEMMENTTGIGGDNERAKTYHWISEDWPLSRIRDEANAIFKKRADVVCKLISGTRQGDLFADSLDDMDVAQVSCGLLCGK